MTLVHLAGKQTTSKIHGYNLIDDDIQPNAIDLRLDKVFAIESKTFSLSENHKIHRGVVQPPMIDEYTYFLQKGSYEITMQGEIEIGPDEAGWVITRSTLNRNGIFITSGLYDSAYHGIMAACMHVNCGTMEITRGTRVAQMIIFKAEALKQYNGSYGYTKDGILKTGEEKYYT
jgi:deoxycytidine triphosphate deaminase